MGAETTRIGIFLATGIKIIRRIVNDGEIKEQSFWKMRIKKDNSSICMFY